MNAFLPDDPIDDPVDDTPPKFYKLYIPVPPTYRYRNRKNPDEDGSKGQDTPDGGAK